MYYGGIRGRWIRVLPPQQAPVAAHTSRVLADDVRASSCLYVGAGVSVLDSGSGAVNHTLAITTSILARNLRYATSAGDLNLPLALMPPGLMLTCRR